MTEVLQELADHYQLRLPPPLGALLRALPEGADFGTVRLLAPAEIASGVPEARLLTPALLPFAVAHDAHEAFALYVPPESAAAVGAVCAVNLETGVYAPLAQSLRGWGAWTLLVRQAQAGLAAREGGDLAALVEESAGAAFALARALDLDGLLARAVEPDAEALATALLDFEPASPWACSALAAAEAGSAAMRRLAPALAGAPFSAGLFEQASDVLLSTGDTARAARSVLAALSRLEPNLQCAPNRVDEPDPETGETFAPFQPAAAFWFLQEHLAQLPREALDTAAYAYLSQALAGGGARCGLALEPGEVIEWSRRRGLGGDLPGGRWALHLAFAESRGRPEARAALAEELARDWDLAGSRWYAERFAAIARDATP